jgi:hypothetical protein
MKASEKIKNTKISDKGIHRMFQFGALLMAGLVFYNLYFGDPSKLQLQPEENKNYLTEEQINEKVKIALDKIIETSDFKAVKDFISYAQGAVTGGGGKIMDTNEGIFIFVPKADIESKNNKIIVENETLKLEIKSEKKQNSSLKTPESSQKASPEVK